MGIQRNLKAKTFVVHTDKVNTNLNLMNDGDGLEKRSLLVSHIMSCQKSSFRLNEFEDDVFTINDEDYSTRCLLFWVKKNLRTFNLL